MSLCSVCSSKYLAAIESALASGESKSAIGKRHGVSRHAIKRHVDHSVEGVIVEASRPELEGRLYDLDGRLVALEAVLQRTLDEAIAAGKANVVTTVSREIRQTLESIAKIRGQLDERPVVNLAVVPEFRSMTSKLLDALLPYPEARLAASGALLGIAHESGSQRDSNPHPGHKDAPDEGLTGIGSRGRGEEEDHPGDAPEPFEGREPEVFRRAGTVGHVSPRLVREPEEDADEHERRHEADDAEHQSQPDPRLKRRADEAEHGEDDADPQAHGSEGFVSHGREDEGR